MNIQEGSVVSLEGSDTLWQVLEVDKGKMRVLDDLMGIIELEDVPVTDVTGILSEDEVA